MAAVLGVPLHDLVVITGSDDAAFSVLVKTPNLTIRVRGHDGLLVITVAESDGTVTGANNHLTVEAVDSADEGREIHGLHNLSGDGVNAVDLAILATGPELALSPTKSADEALTVERPGLLQLTVITPDVDLGVGATSVEFTLGASSDASETGHFTLSAEDTLLLLTTGLSRVPEANVVLASSGESSATGLLIPTDVENLGLATSLLEDHLT